jgi:hypothetical protein
VNYLVSPSSWGYPTYSEKLGIVFKASGPGMRWPTQMPPEGAPEVVIKGEDSSVVLAMDVATRKIDTLARLSVGYQTVMKISYNNVNSDDVGDLFPIPDDWAVMADGSVALLGGREYRIRWINPDGTHSESPRLPYVWKRNDDNEKQRLVDSINAGREKSYQDRLASLKKQQAIYDSAKADKTGKTPIPPAFQNGPPRPPTRQPRLDVAEIPDYMPAYDRSSGSFRADADNNLWIRPRQARNASGGPIYDVVNRKGELIDRVQLPAGRSLIGFGPGGVVYLTARDAGATRIEQVRFK